VKAATVEESVLADVVILAVPFPGGTRCSQLDIRLGRPHRHRLLRTLSISQLLLQRTWEGRLSSEIVAEAVSGARVVKAFNTLAAAALASNPSEAGGRRVIFISSDDADAIAMVSALCERLGFYPINLGRISECGRLQQFGGPFSTQNLIRID